jgi:exopolysaccharide biosynthesis protein
MQTSIRIGWFLLAGWLAGCALITQTPPPTPAPPVPAHTDQGWQTLAPGLERRMYVPDQTGFSQLEVLRIDPAHFHFRVHYQPGLPARVTEWRDNLPGAVAFINANFFDPDHRVLGLLVADGVVYGSAYRDRGGIFAIQADQPQVRSSLRQPYQGEPLEQAVQAFPMLVQDGLPAFSDSGQDRITRRTAIAQDRTGRILLIATPGFGLTLTLSAFLPDTDMDIVTAFNLDGGGSTMMYYNPDGMAAPFMLPSLDPVPAVLAIYRR